MKFKNLVKISLIFIVVNFQACSYVNTDKIGRVLSTEYYELDTTPKDVNVISVRGKQRILSERHFWC